MPAALPDDEFVARYTTELLYSLNVEQQVFKVVYAGAGSNSTANTLAQATTLCQSKDSQPIGVIIWQLFQERSASSFVFVKRYRTDAQLNMYIYSCHGPIATATASAGPAIVGLREDGANTTVPLVGLLGTAALGFYHDGKDKTSDIAVTVASLLGGGVSGNPISQNIVNTTIPDPELGLNEVSDRADRVEKVIAKAGYWLSLQNCEDDATTAPAAVDPDVLSADEERLLSALRLHDFANKMSKKDLQSLHKYGVKLPDLKLLVAQATAAMVKKPMTIHNLTCQPLQIGM